MFNRPSDLDLEHINPILSQYTPALTMWQQMKSGAKKDQQSIRYSRDNPILITVTIIVTLILKRSIQSFLMTLWLWMMYHPIKSSHKRLMSSEDIVQTHSHTPTQQFWNAPQTLSWWVWTQLASQGSPKMDSGSTWWVHQRWNTLCQGHHVMYWGQGEG